MNNTTSGNLNNSSNDEVDILLLIYKVFLLIKRRFIVLIISAIIGVFIGFAGYIAQKSTYKSTLIANSDILRNEYVTLLFKNLNDLLKEGNIDALANYLKISPQIAETITKIEATTVILKEGLNESNSDKLVNTFQIEITTLDPSKLDTIQKGIIFYIQTNDFVKKKVMLQKIFLQSMILKIDLEINKLDTLRNLGRNNREVTFLDPAAINNSIVNLYERKINYQNSIETLNQVLIIQNFIKYMVPVGPKLTIYIPAGISTGLIGGLIFIFLLEVRRKYIKIY